MSPSPASAVDVAVVGAGIVGLAIADAWLAANPRDSLVVYDKEPSLAVHASGRNSGVLHAGFYYAPGSLKARLTREGNLLARDFCAERGVAVREAGKVVVTSSSAELDALDELLRIGRANDVELEMIDELQLRELEPLAHTHGRALWSPTTAVIDPVTFVGSMAERVRQRGGRVALGCAVTSAGPGWLQTTADGEVQAGHIINAAGLYADTVAHWFGVGMEYRMLPFKGLYWYGNWPAGRLQRHVYPVPDPRNPFLGVHLTATVDGKAKIGPTAIPARWREDYGGLRYFSGSEAWDIARTYPRFLTSKHHDVLGLLRAELPKYSRKHLVAQGAKLVPSVRAKDFATRGMPGVRAQLFHVPDKRLEMDFVVRDGAGSTHILNAVSPALTSSLAVGKHVVDSIHATRPGAFGSA